MRMIGTTNSSLLFITTTFIISMLSVVESVSRLRIFAVGGGRKSTLAAFCTHTSHTSAPAQHHHHTHAAHWHAERHNNNWHSRHVGRTSLFSSTTKGEPEYDWNTLVPFEKHTHNSIKITINEAEAVLDDDPYAVSTFHSKLQATLETAQQLHKSAIWITVHISRAQLIAEASKLGFEYHHADGSTATLCKWIIGDQESRIPTYATHQVGVGAVVINSAKDEILCVKEKRNNYRPWKIPGGLAELGEHLDEAVIREVREETGINCNFLHVLAVRHTHAGQFNRSDLYFVCLLEPITDTDGKLPQPTPQPGEIEAVAWLPMIEYRNMVFSEDKNVGHPMMQRIVEVLDNSSQIERFVVPSIVPGRKQSPLYHAPINSNNNR